ncbi:MAG: hypothetical protein IIB67_03555 [Proteobacteria bacterium]|nr:hypothetical protein [Pseudomonadota bacterium]
MARRIEETSFLFGSNSIFVEDLYARYLADPNSVDVSWQKVFAEFGDDRQAVADESRGAPWAPRVCGMESESGDEDDVNGETVARMAPAPGSGSRAAIDKDAALLATRDSIRLRLLIHIDLIDGEAFLAGLDGSPRRPANPLVRPDCLAAPGGAFDAPIGDVVVALREAHEVAART